MKTSSHSTHHPSHNGKIVPTASPSPGQENHTPSVLSTSLPLMLPTPDTSHVSYSRVYEPAEDSFLLLDTLSSAGETAFLQQRFSQKGSSNNRSQRGAAAAAAAAPLIVEVGTGSGVVIGFVHAHAATIFGTSTGVLTAGIDVNSFACRATVATVRKAAADQKQQQQQRDANVGDHDHGDGDKGSALFLGAVRGDLLSPLGRGQVDVLIFNPPYVPTEELPLTARLGEEEEGPTMSASKRFERDSYLLSLSYAGGKDGMEITDRLIEALPEALSPRGCAYILLCAGNKPEEVKDRIKRFGPEWRVLTVGDSGKQAGWEKLQIIRIWRESWRETETHG